MEAELFERSECRCREELSAAQQGLSALRQRLPALRQAHAAQAAELKKLELEVNMQKKEREEVGKSLF